MKAKSLFLILFSLFLANTLFAQSIDSTLVRIETADGNEFVGKIVKEDASQLVLETTNLGQLTIKKADIKSRELVQAEQLKDGKLWFSNPQSTRYFWAPNGYGLKAGEAYYQNIYVLWNQFTFGITDNFSLGGGIIPTFLFSGPTPVFATAKFSIPIEKDKLNLGAGTIVGTIIGEDVGAFGLVYGLSTFGSPDNNVSVGFAYGFADGEWANSPLINVSGLFRIASRGYFITENYFVHGDGESLLIMGLGGRWIIKKAALDFIFGIPIGADMDSFVAVPLIGFTIPFGNKK
ncbi:hypothetical protein [uncultured Draconibacterium sp.]|uniref:hypothetical protein n=1 Tax=uncultured Draconibacterium sp. TaxID=1573823 RepID=UPI0032163033